MEPLNLAVCDDLPEEREKLLALLEQAPIATICTQFGSSEELLEAFRPGTRPRQRAAVPHAAEKKTARRPQSML